MNIVAILQARTGSTRLPNKILLPLAGKSMVQNIVERVSRATRVNKVVVAAPCRDALSFIDIGVSATFYNGDENDLVGRYLDAAQYHQADLIVRVPCDNPCVDPAYIDAAVERYLSGHKIFMTNTSVYIGERCYDGMGAEVFSMSRLKWLDEHTKGHPQYREHPHLWFYDHLIDVYDPHKNDSRHPVIRLDVNTREDYEFIKTIYDHFGHNRFTTQEVLTFLHGVPA